MRKIIKIKKLKFYPQIIKVLKIWANLVILFAITSLLLFLWTEVFTAIQTKQIEVVHGVGRNIHWPKYHTIEIFPTFEYNLTISIYIIFSLLCIFWIWKLIVNIGTELNNGRIISFWSIIKNYSGLFLIFIIFSSPFIVIIFCIVQVFYI